MLLSSGLGGTVTVATGGVSTFLLRSCHAFLAALVLAIFENSELVALVVFAGLDVLLVVVLDFEVLSEVLPVRACATELIPKKSISIRTTHALVSFFITFSFFVG